MLLLGANLELCQRLGERLLKTVRREPFNYQEIAIPATVSVGVAEMMSGEKVQAWLGRADNALYRAKESGRNQLCLALETDLSLSN